jgi:hypothetical protein
MLSVTFFIDMSVIMLCTTMTSVVLLNVVMLGPVAINNLQL